MKLLLMVVTVIISVSLIPLDAEAQKGWKTHTVEDRYSFKYPSNCDLEEKENRFTSIDATLDCKGASIHFESGLPTGFQSDTSLVDALESVAKSIYDASVFESGADKYTINNQTAPYVIATYSKENLFGNSNDYVVLGMIIKFNDDDYIIGQYLNNENDFDSFLENAEKIFQSVTPVNATT